MPLDSPFLHPHHRGGCLESWLEKKMVKPDFKNGTPASSCLTDGGGRVTTKGSRFCHPWRVWGAAKGGPGCLVPPDL